MLNAADMANDTGPEPRSETLARAVERAATLALLANHRANATTIEAKNALSHAMNEIEAGVQHSLHKKRRSA